MEDYENIHKTMQSLRARPDEAPAKGKNSLPDKLGQIKTHAGEVASLLKSICMIDVPSQEEVFDLCRIVSYRFGYTPECVEDIYRDLCSREQVSTQIIPELDLALLHCRTNGVSSPVIAFMHSSEGLLTKAEPHNPKSAMIMLVPKTSSSMLLVAIGAVSSAIIEDDNFLQSIHDANEESVYTKLTTLFLAHMQTCCNDIFKE